MNGLLSIFRSPSKRQATPESSAPTTSSASPDDDDPAGPSQGDSAPAAMKVDTPYATEDSQDEYHPAGSADTASHESQQHGERDDDSSSGAGREEDSPGVQPKRSSRQSIAAAASRQAKAAPPASRTRLSRSQDDASRSAAAGSSSKKRAADPSGSTAKGGRSPSKVHTEIFFDLPISARKSKAVKRTADDLDDHDEVVKQPKKRSRRAASGSSEESEETDDSGVKPKRGRPSNGNGAQKGKAGAKAAKGSKKRQQQKQPDPTAGWDPAPLTELADPSRSKKLQSIELTNESAERAGVRVGDVIELAGSSAEDPWLAKIQSIAGCNDDFIDLVDDDDNPVIGANGTVSKQLLKPWFQVSWLYSRLSFLALTADARWGGNSLEPLGEREFIETDHTDIVQREELNVPFFETRESSAETVYRFDDLYPASAPKSASRSSHPLLPFRPRRKKEPRFSIPSFYWGDLEAADDSDSEEASSFYVRTSFGFGGKPDLKKAGIDQVYPKAITFNKHSAARKPYNPKRVQVFGRTSQEWCDVDWLKKNKHHTAANNARALSAIISSDSDDSEGTDYDEPPKSSATAKQKATKKSKAQSKGKGEGKTTLAEALRRLSKAEIIRGGAYGVIGNAYLVTRAAELLEIIAEGDEEDVADAEEEGQQLVKDEEAWTRGVEERKKSGLPAGAPPKGSQWAPP